MKNYLHKSLGIVCTSLFLFLSFLANNARATLAYWDPQKFWGSYATYTNGSLSGTWESISWARNATGGSGPPADKGTNATVAWNDANNDAAVFAVGAGATNSGNSATTMAFTITLTTNHTVAGFFDGALNPDSCIVTLNGPGIITMPSGLQACDLFNSSDSSLGQLIINTTLAGAGANLTMEGNGQVFLNGTNTLTGGVNLGFSGSSFIGIVNFYGSGSFGTGPIVASNGFGSALVVEGTSAATVTNSFIFGQSSNSVNIVGNPAGVTFSGPVNLNANRVQVGAGGATNNLVTFSGVVSGTGSFTKFNPGIMALNGVNTYTGGTTNKAGVLQLNSIADANCSIGPSGTFTLGGGAVQYTGASAASTSRQFSGTSATTSEINLPAGNLTLSGRVTGSAAFTVLKTGPGTLTLSGGTGDNSFMAATVNGGTLALAKASTSSLHGLGGNSTINNGGTVLLGGTGGDQVFTSVTITNNAGGTLDMGGTSEGFAMLVGSGIVTNSGASASTLQLGEGTASGTFSGVIEDGASGTVALTKTGTGTLTLNGANTYSGATTVNQGIVALGASGSLGNASSLILSNAATFDVSGLGASATYNLGSSASLTAIGVAAGGTIKGGASGTVNLGAQPIILSFTPTLFNGDPSHPALVVSQGTLSLNGNSFTVTNAAATPLGVGNYLLVNQTTGNISSSGSYSVAVAGTGLAANTAAAIVVSGNTVSLAVTPTGGNFNTYFSNIAHSQNFTYGTSTATLSGTLSGQGPLYPNNGESVTITLGSIVTNTVISDNTGDFTLTTPINTLAAGSYVINYSYAGNTNIGTTVAADTSTALGITKAPMTVTASAQSKTYGQAVATGAGNTNFTTSGIQNTETIGSVTIAVSGSGAATNAAVSGSPYTITPSAATGGTFTAGNYTITYATGLLTVNPAPLTLTGNNASRAYSATNPAFGVTYTGFVNAQTLASSDVRGTPSLVTAATTNSPIGAYDITNTIGTLTSTNYSFATFVDGTLTINPLAVRLTGTRPYDGTNDVDSSILTITNNIDDTNLTLSGTGLLAGANAGAEAISDFSGLTLNGTAATNYTLSGASGTVTVTTLPLTITASAQSKNYGQSLSLGNTAFTVGSGLFGSESVTAVTLTSPGTAANASVAGSPYIITPSAATGINGFLAANYSITYVTNSLTVSAVPLSITAAPQSKTYGQNLAFGSGSVAFTSVGLSNSETIGSVTLACTGGASNSPVSGSPYAIAPSAATGGTFNPGNYVIAYNAGLLTVNPALLTVKANDASVPYGTTNVSLTVTYSNFVNGEVLGTSDVAGSPSLASAGLAPNSPTGSYAISNSIGTLTSTNYTFNLVNGTLTVAQLAVNLTGTRVYDGSNDADSSILTIATNYDGTNVTLSGSALLAGSAAGAEAISDFSGLSLGGTAATNYTLSNATGSVTITGAPLSITAYSTNKTYGTAITLDSTGFTIGGTLVGPETVTSVTQSSGGAAAGAGVAGSPYAITPSAAVGANGFLAANYSITYNPGALTIDPLVAVLSGARPYDGTAAAAAGILTVANVVGGDDVILASGSGTLASGSVGTNALVSVGTLALGGTTAPNYTLSGATGSVLVSNPHTPFIITSSTFDHVGTNVVIVYQSVPGVVYQVLSSPNVAAPLNTWTNEGSAVTAVGTVTTNVIPASTSGTKTYIVKDVQ